MITNTRTAPLYNNNIIIHLKHNLQYVQHLRCIDLKSAKSPSLHVNYIIVILMLYKYVHLLGLLGRCGALHLLQTRLVENVSINTHLFIIIWNKPAD